MTASLWTICAIMILFREEYIMKKSPGYDSIRQQNVLLEKISSDVKMIAEDHGGLVQSIGEIKDTLHEHERRFDRIEIALLDTNARVKKLEQKVDELEQKVDTVITNHEHRIQNLEPAH